MILVWTFLSRGKRKSMMNNFFYPSRVVKQSFTPKIFKKTTNRELMSTIQDSHIFKTNMKHVVSILLYWNCKMVNFHLETPGKMCFTLKFAKIMHLAISFIHSGTRHSFHTFLNEYKTECVLQTEKHIFRKSEMQLLLLFSEKI